MDSHGRSSVSQSNQAIVALFKDLVLTQSMAVPVAAMNALVLKLKVILKLPLSFSISMIISRSSCERASVAMHSLV